MHPTEVEEVELRTEIKTKRQRGKEKKNTGGAEL